MTLLEKLSIQDWDDDKKAMLEALIRSTALLDWMWENTYLGDQVIVKNDIQDNVTIIESATGRSWDEIKEMV